MKYQKTYYVYIATNNPRNTVLYTGVSSGLYRRALQHKNKTFNNSFTAKYNIDKIVYYESFGDANDAISREKQIKRLTRRKKIELINKNNPNWFDIFKTCHPGAKR